MREIKFKVQQTSASKSIFGAKGLSLGKTNLMTGDTFELKGTSKVVYLQYTGLKDKHGKEIYEGDIFKGGWATKPELVEWVDSIVATDQMDDEYEVGSGWNIGTDSAKLCEVIGNIYENPGLLK